MESLLFYCMSYGHNEGLIPSAIIPSAMPGCESYESHHVFIQNIHAIYATRSLVIQ